jgi:hypothetical protein
MGIIIITIRVPIMDMVQCVSPVAVAAPDEGTRTGADAVASEGPYEGISEGVKEGKKDGIEDGMNDGSSLEAIG